MKNHWITLGAVILATAALFIWGSTVEKENSQHTKVVLGVLVPLTGASASIGERVKAGIEAGVAEVEARDGYRLNVVFEDDRGEASTAVSAAQKLIQTDGTKIIIGTVKSDAMLAVAPLTEQNKAVLLSPTAGAEAISSAGDFVFRLIETPDIHGKAAAKYLRGNKVALFTANASNAQSYGKFFKSNFEDGGGILVSDIAYDQSATDFRTDVAKAVSAGADAFYLAVATARDAGILTRQIREAGFSGTIMVSVAADAQEFFDTAGPYAEGAILTASFFDSTSSEGKKFNARYKAITGTDGDGFSANGYDAVLLIADALKRCGGDKNTACVRDFLYTTKEYQGAGGILSFDKNGDVVKPVSIKVARDGKFVADK